MQNLLLTERNVVRLKNATLPKGTCVKLQPHTKDFLDISNPKAILETTLRSFSYLTTGDSIMVAYNNKKYYIDIVETKPSSAISIIETDCEVDFAPPLDYIEPERVQRLFLQAKCLHKLQLQNLNQSQDSAPSLDPAVSSPDKSPQSEATNGVKPSTASTSQGSSSRQTSGKLVFGSNANAPKAQPKVAGKETKEEPPKSEEPKFQAFTGKKYSLRG